MEESLRQKDNDEVNCLVWLIATSSDAKKIRSLKNIIE